MLDSLCKKILKYMNSQTTPADTQYDFSGDIDDMAAELNQNTEAVRSAIRYLEEIGYIKYAMGRSGNPYWFHLDHKGLHWREIRFRNFLKYLGNHWISFFAMLISAASIVLSLIALLSK